MLVSGSVYTLRIPQGMFTPHQDSNGIPEGSSSTYADARRQDDLLLHSPSIQGEFFDEVLVPSGDKWMVGIVVFSCGLNHR